MQFAVNVPNFGEYADPRTMAELAATAERSGWDGFFVWDHMMWFSGNVVGDPWVQLAAVADATSTIKLGPMVTPLPRRRPWVVARQAVSLDQLCEGRLILGVGIGFPPDTEFGLFGEVVDAKTRGDMLDEALEIIVGLWSGEEYVHEGTHYSLGPMTFLPRPVQHPRIPIWVAGFWPNKRPFRRAARFDGVFPIKSGEGMDAMSSDDWSAMHAFIREHRPTNAPYETSSFHSGTVTDLAEAGVDWVHVGSQEGTSYDDFLARVAAGPPA